MDLRQVKDLEEAELAELNIDSPYKLERALGVMCNTTVPNASLELQYFVAKEDQIVNDCCVISYR